MAEVSQNANGKWKIVDIKHDESAPSDVTIPATFTYRNKEVHLNITTTPQTVETEWVTQLGVKLNIDAVDRKYKKVTRKEDDGWKTYEAYDEFSDSDIIPFTETLAVNCTNRNPGSSTGSSTLSITSNTSWVITVEYAGSDTGWVHVPVTAGTGDTSQTITYDANTGTTQRKATIVIKTSTKEERIQITQAGFVPTISISAATPIAATATGISYTVTSNVSKVKVKLGSTTKTTKTGTFTISENTATTSVSYVITASCTDYPTYSATTTVSQNAAGVELDASCSNTTPGSQQSTATLTIDSNVNWTISTNVDWITVATPLSGSGDATRNVTFAENASTSQRTGKITVTGGGITREITITQDGAEPLPEDYLAFNITSPGAIRWKATSLDASKTIEYRKNGGSWVTIASSTGNSAPSISVTTGDKVEFRGDNMIYGGVEGGAHHGSTFSGTTAEFNLEGNIMSLVNSTGFSTAVTLTGSYNFAYLFLYCTGLTSAENLSLPATTLTPNCYHYMFAQCHSLVTPPELPAMTLASYCYKRMFLCCYALATVPELPATTLAVQCYWGMFEDCTGLTTSQTILPATTLAVECYQYMFWKCSSLTTAPELPATALTTGCYGFMFKECKKLETAPELPATTLADSCYAEMFYSCERLTTAPALPATTLANYCYSEMFRDCKRIETAPVLLAPTLVDSCYQRMFNGCNRLNYIRCLATSITASDCTTAWTSSVSGAGTFVAARGTGWILDSPDGIPRGWTIQYEGGGGMTTVYIALSGVLEAIPTNEDFCVAFATGTSESSIVVSATCVPSMSGPDAYIVIHLEQLGLTTATPLYFLWKTTGANYNMNLGVGTSPTGTSLRPWVGDTDPSLINVTGTWHGSGNSITGWPNETFSSGALYGIPLQ